MKNPAFNCCIEPRRPQLEDPPQRRESLPCTDEFIANGGDYERLPGGGEVVAYGVYAKSEEYPKPVLLPEYVGSMGVIRDRVLSKARREGFTGDFVERMAELGWWIEPLTLASAPLSAPVGVEAVPGFSMDDMALCEAGVWSLQESDSHVQECQAVAISKLIQFVYAALAQQPAAVDGAKLSRIVSEWRSGVIGATEAMISIDGIVRQPGGSDNDR